MSDLKTDQQEGLLVLRMARGRVNALNSAMVEDLNAAVDEAARDDSITGLVLGSDCRGFFSAGFDVEEVSDYGSETATLYFARFIDLYESLFLLPKPVVTAVAGHALGAGAVLAISSDLRIFAKGHFDIALNDVDLGVVFPPGLTQRILQTFGVGVARELLLSGDPMTPQRAQELGIASELAEPAFVLERALERCQGLARKPQAAYAAIKRSIRELSRGTFCKGDRNYLSEFVEYWFSREAQENRRALLASLAAKRTNGS